MAQTADTDSYLDEVRTERKFERSTWEEATAGIDYSKDLEKEQEKLEEETIQPATKDTESSFFDHGINSNLAIILLIIIGLVLLFFILQAAMGSNIFVRNKKIKTAGTSLSLEEIEENLAENDPTDLIEQAVNAGNYRLALRLYYLKIIRELSLADVISWKRDKTNGDYLKELRMDALHVPFRNITLAFERIWYGNRNLSAQEFQQIRPEFDHFINSIPKHEK